jgi:hypothetical protein
MSLKNHKIVQATTVTAGAAGTTDVTSDAIDTAGFDGCTFVIPFGAIVSGAATSVKAQQCDTSGGSYADLTGTAQTVADTADDTTFYIEVLAPREQFLKCVVDRGTQNATVGAIYAILWSASNRPVTYASPIAGESFYSPAEGTA